MYENLIFHRVIPDFMIQTGDPTETGAHECGFRLPDEFVASLKFDRPGRLAMANAGPGTAACQFFITEDKYPEGDGHYTIFGQVVDGQPVVAKISHVIRDDQGQAQHTHQADQDHLHAHRRGGHASQVSSVKMGRMKTYALILACCGTLAGQTAANRPIVQELVLANRILSDQKRRGRVRARERAG